MGIHKKLLDIQKEIKSVSKDGTIETKNGSYKILSHGRVMELTRDLFLQHNLVFYPEVYSFEKSGSITTVNAQYIIVDVDSEETIRVGSVGQGSDTQDKGAGKASTYADKYLILRLLRLIQEDDPDNTSSDKMTEKISEIERRAQTAKEYLDGLKRDGLVDQDYYASAKKWLDTFAANGDENSISEAEKQMKILREEQ